MKNLAFIFILLILFGCGDKKKYPNKISDFRNELQIHLKRLALEKELPSDDKIATDYLKEKCTKNELIKLLDCENPKLRLIAYRTILDRKEKGYFNILLGHLNDTSTVSYRYNECVYGEAVISELLISYTVERLSPSEKNRLVDSVLLKYPSLGTSTWILQSIEPNEKYYSIIKQKSKIVTDRCGDQLSACFALSKFNKKEDFGFLTSIFSKLEGPCEDWIFKSIERNPNEIYFPILEKYLNQKIKKEKQSDSDELKYYCRAIANYKNKKSLLLLTEILDKKNYPDTWYFTYNEEYVFRAIHKCRVPIYDELYKKLKSKMSEDVIEGLDNLDWDDFKTW